MNKDKLPYYNIVLNDEEDSGLEFVSFVAEPAIMEMGLAFSTASSFKFSEEKQIVVGPAMIPDVPLYRNINGEEFFVVFTKEVIDKLSEKFNKQPKEFKINVDHADAVESAFIKSNWIIEDKENDKSNMYGFNMPEGTWMLEVKVTDPAFWQNEIKEQGKFGFSVEGLFDLEFIGNFNKTPNTMEIKDLSPEELAMIEKFRAESEAPEETPEAEAEVVIEAEADEVDEEAEAAERAAQVAATEDEEDEEIEAAEDEEEVVVEEAPEESEEAPVMDEEAVRAIVDAKFDELMGLIAELKTMIEAPAEEEETEEGGFSSHEDKLNLVKTFRKQYKN